MQQLYPWPRADVAIDAVYADLGWAPRDGRPFVALNMVSSVDGRATVNGTAAGIGSPVDRTLMMALRAAADALLYGAGTLRSDPVGRGVPARLVPRRTARGLAPQPLLVVLTASGDVPLERRLFAEPERALVFVARSTPAAAVARLRARAAVRVAGLTRPDPTEVMRVLREEYSVRHVLCEGGPALNRSLLAAGLLDEVFLTLAPRLVAGDGLPLVAGPLLAPSVLLSLGSVYEHDGEIYLRYCMAGPER